MKPPHDTTQTLSVKQQQNLSPIPQRRTADQNPSRWDTLDKALHLLIQQEESLLGDALTQCNQLLKKSHLQVEEIQEFLNEEE